MEATQNDQDLDRADDEIGQHLAEHDLDGRRRHGEQILHRAAFGLPGQRDGSHHHHGHLQDHAKQARDDVVLRDAFGVVAPVHDDIELRFREFGGFRLRALLAQQRPLRHGAERRNGPACNRRIGGVSLDQYLWLVAAFDTAGEVGGDGDQEGDGAVRHQRLRFRRALDDMVEAVVAGHPQGGTIARV